MMNRSTILVMLLCLFTLVGCKDNETAIVYETNDDLLNRNNITDVVMVFQRIEQEGETLYYGNRKGKDWFALLIILEHYKMSGMGKIDIINVLIFRRYFLLN